MLRVPIVSVGGIDKPATELPTTGIEAIQSNASYYLIYESGECFPNWQSPTYAADLAADASAMKALKGAYPVVTSLRPVISTSIIINGLTFSRQSPIRQSCLMQDGVNPVLFYFELNPGDICLSVDGANAVVERSELQCNTTMSFNVDYEITYWLKINVPDSAAIGSAAWAIYGQIHATKDAADIAVSPTFSRETGATRSMLYSSRTSTSNPLTINPPQILSYNNLLPNWGSWVRVKEQHRFDPTGGKGYHRVWHDDLQIVNYAGNTGYVDAIGPYYKIGIYRAMDSKVKMSALFCDFKQYTV